MKLATVLLAAPILILPVACTSDDGTGPPTDPEPASLTAVMGDDQTATVGTALSDSLVVQVVDTEGNVMAGVSVAWEVTGGGGSVSESTVSTGAAGRARVAWTLGTAAGANTAQAAVSGVPSTTFTATGTPDRPAEILLTADSVAFSAVGDTASMEASVRDRYENPVDSATVSWAPSDTLVADVDTDGIVTSRGEGVAEIMATSDTAHATVTVVVEQVAAAVALSPSADTMTAGDSLQLVASASDANGVTVSDATFVWSTSDTAVAPVDEATGLVTGRVAGTATITAETDGATGQAAISVEPGPADTIYASAGGGQTGRAGEPLADSVAVRVVDSFGNGVTGEMVAFSPLSGSGSVSPASAVTDESGLAKTEWTLGDHAGTDTLAVESSGLAGSPLSVTATATPNGTITGVLTLTSAAQAFQLATAYGGLAASREDEPTRLHHIGMAPGTRTVFSPMAERVPGSLIITFRSDAVGAPAAGSRTYLSSSTAQAVANELRTRLGNHAARDHFDVRGTSPAILAARIGVDPARMESVRAALLRDPAVLAVEPDGVAYALGGPGAATGLAAYGTTPNDPLYRPQMWHYNSIDLPAAWDITTGTSDVLVAIVDDGIRFDHPAVAGNLTTDGYDFVSNVTVDICGTPMGNAGDGDDYDPDPTIPVSYNTSSCTYGIGHGLHVAGTVGAVGNDATGVTGVNWTVSIRPVRAIGINGSGSTYDIAQGILYAAGLPADNGSGGTVQASTTADVINLSLGAPTSSTYVQNAIEAADSAGSLLVASAGNSATSDPRYPAAYPEVVSVSAVGPDWNLASYSSYGSTVDVAAPGGDFSDGNATYGIASTGWDFSADQPGYYYSQGTSMAAPHVSGVAALVLAHDPSLTSGQLRSRLLDYAVDLGAAGRDDEYGYGLVNARNSLTRTPGPTRSLFARLYDSATGTILDMVPAEPDGSYTFSQLDDGAYYVFAGRDNEGDQQVGVPGRRWGAYAGTTTSPTQVVVSGADVYSASFSAGWPYESEANDILADADQLVINGYVHGDFSATTDVDVFRVTVPDGQYTIETSGWLGACWYAGEADTMLELYDGNGALIASNDDIDLAVADYCSRITSTVSAGTYEIRVTYVSGGPRYRLEFRDGT